MMSSKAAAYGTLFAKRGFQYGRTYAVRAGVCNCGRQQGNCVCAAMAASQLKHKLITTASVAGILAAVGAGIAVAYNSHGSAEELKATIVRQ